jgi:hypothetical protein
MNWEQALAVLAVAAFGAFVLWGRTAAGRRALQRLLPPAAQAGKRPDRGKPSSKPRKRAESARK